MRELERDRERERVKERDRKKARARNEHARNQYQSRRQNGRGAFVIWKNFLQTLFIHSS